MAAEPSIVKAVEADRNSDKVAQAKLVNDLAGRMDEEFSKNGTQGELVLNPEPALDVVLWAMMAFASRHSHEHALARFDPPGRIIFYYARAMR